MTDIFAVQEEIATSVAGVLGVTLSVGSNNSFRGAGTDSYQAYVSFLQSQSFSPKHPDAIALLEKAISLDPDYGAALASLGLSIASTMWGNPVERAPELIEQSMPYVNRAVEINPDSAYAYSLQATVNYGLFNFIESEDYHQKAIDIDSQDGTNLSHYGNMLMRTGKSSAALRYYELAYNAEKHPVPAGILQLNAYLALENYESALQFTEQLPEITRPSVRYFIALNQRKPAQIRAAMADFQSIRPQVHSFISPVVNEIDSPVAAVARLKVIICGR